MEEALIAIFGQVLKTAKEGETDAEAGQSDPNLLTEQGGIDTLAERCETVSAWHSNNDLPLLWPIHAKHPEPAVPAARLDGHPLGDPGPSLLDALGGRG